MKEKIKVALKQKYSHTGLGDDVMDGVATILAGNVTEETQIDTVVAGCEPLLKVVQGALDKERNARSEAEKRARELEAKKKQDEEQEKDDESGKTKPEDNDPLSSILAKFESLSSKLDALTKENTQKTKLEQLTNLLTEKKVPESYYKSIIQGRSFGDDFNAEDYATEVSNGWTALQKEMADERFKDVQAPDKGNAGIDNDNPLAKMISEGTKEIIGANKK